ncbi:MAG: hypothetical protein R3351_01175 [Nitrospirales bacterium]|nr:hypothetical protein [Nitrospirales bacterium]
MKKLSHCFNLNLIVCLLIVSISGVVHAADHGDTPLLMSIGRHDARLADLFAFTRGDNLVLCITSDPTIPPEVTEYVFPTDVEFTIAIDKTSRVRKSDPEDLAKFGGTIVRPARIKENIIFKITFNQNNEPQLYSNRPHLLRHTSLFAGLRDDPFIRGPRIGKNIAAIVLELPVVKVLGFYRSLPIAKKLLRKHPTLLIWATASVEEVTGRFQELAGRALRSQFPENDLMNTLHPNRHFQELGVPPDVIIFDTSAPAVFPNGRELTDDVVDLVGDPRPLGNDTPFPDANDVPFLDVFPYLAPPHLP